MTRPTRIWPWLLLVGMAASIPAPAGAAPLLTTLHNFMGTDGAEPAADVTFDRAGNLYGTTEFDGSGGDGTVFEITADGTFQTLHSFTGADGANPLGRVTFDSAGDLYGTTFNGGGSDEGTVFEITVGGVFRTLHSFSFAGTDGVQPMAGVIIDSTGNIYGTTEYGGGNSGDGTVFEITANGTFQTLHSFTGTNGSGQNTDGAYPTAGVTLDSAGNLYGTTIEGGSGGAGTVFEIAAGGIFQTLHSFTSFTGTDGANPLGSVAFDSAGNLYGTTSNGGNGDAGTVFEVTAGGIFQTLYSFTSPTGTSGAYPLAGVTFDSAGNFYGTTSEGGSGGVGTVFEITAGGIFQTLHSFGSFNGTGENPDGANPYAGVTLDSADKLYGVTADGGSGGAGTVFRLNGPTSVQLEPGTQTLTTAPFTATATSNDGNPLAYQWSVKPAAGFASPATGSVTSGASFPNILLPVTAGTYTVTVTVADDQGKTATATRQVTFMQLPLGIAALTLSNYTVIGGTSLLGTVTLNAAPATDTVVILVPQGSCATPASVTVKAGTTSAMFIIRTVAVPQKIGAAVLTNLSGGKQTKIGFTLLPPQVDTLVLAPNAVIGGLPITGVVVLFVAAPMGGTVVNLTSGNPGAVSVPATVIVPAGSSTAAFPVTTTAVTGVTKVTVASVTTGASGLVGAATVTLLP